MKKITKDIEDQLGKKTDSELARRAGVSLDAIRRLRLSKGINSTRKITLWTPEMDSMLGKESDVKTAKKLGVSAMAVTLRRHRLGIPPSRPITKKYEMGTGTVGVVSLTAHVSEEVRQKVKELQEPLLVLYKKTGLPFRVLSMWQIVEFAVNKLHEEMCGESQEK